MDLRAATPEDADLLAFLVNEAGEGIPLHVWRGMAEPGEDPWQVGRRRAMRDVGAFSWRNAVIATLGGQAAGVLIDYCVPDTPSTIDADTPPLFVPLIALENEVCGSWYINVLAVLPELRGRGVGRYLLSVARQRAAAAGAADLSLIVADGNAGACRLYEREGFRLRAALPMVKVPGWDAHGTDWRLLVRPVGPD